MHSTVSTCANAATVASRGMMDSECAVEDVVGGVASHGWKGLTVTVLSAAVVAFVALAVVGEWS